MNVSAGDSSIIYLSFMIVFPQTMQPEPPMALHCPFTNAHFFICSMAFWINGKWGFLSERNKALTYKKKKKKHPRACSGGCDSYLFVYFWVYFGKISTILGFYWIQTRGGLFKEICGFRGNRSKEMGNIRPLFWRHPPPSSSSHISGACLLKNEWQSPPTPASSCQHSHPQKSKILMMWKL